MSANTTLAPDNVMASEVAIKVFAGTITSSPGPTPKTFRAINKASVPFPTPTQCLTLQKEAKAFSKDSTNGPPTKADFDITSEIAESISFLMDSY